MLRNLAAEISVTATEDLTLLSADSLSRYNVVMFALSTGELPISTAGKVALLEFVSSGHRFIGVHSATHLVRVA